MVSDGVHEDLSANLHKFNTEISAAVQNLINLIFILCAFCVCLKLFPEYNSRYS